MNNSTVLAQTRQAATLSSFMAALTTGSAHGRPIKLHVHDALLYIGDMLAWVHQAAQAIAAERELLETLLGIGAGACMLSAMRGNERRLQVDGVRLVLTNPRSLRGGLRFVDSCATSCAEQTNGTYQLLVLYLRAA